MDLIGTFEAAKYCGVTYSTISRWIDSGKIKAFRTVGLHRKILRRDLIAFMKSRNIPLDEIMKENKTTVLVVGNDEKQGKIITDFLNKNNFDASFVSHGFNAGVQLFEMKPHLVILDSTLSARQADELCEHIKTLNSNAKIIQIVQSKTGASSNEQADVCIKKPIDTDMLIEKIHTLLSLVDKR